MVSRYNHYGKLENILNKFDNNYDTLEKKFKKATKKELVTLDKISPNKKLKKSTSIIIPLYRYDVGFEKTLLSLENQTLNELTKLEIIIVTDNKKLANSNTIKKLEKFHLPNLKVLMGKDNFGRCVSRNAGLSVASGEIVIFTNSNLLLEPSCLFEQMIRHDYFDNLLLMGMKKRINVSAKLISNSNIKSGKLNISPHGIKSKLEEGITNNILLKTNFFKELGCGKTVTTNIVKEEFRKTDFNNSKLNLSVDLQKQLKWDLPKMAVFINLSLDKKTAIKVGGFDERFLEWCWEDGFFAAKVISEGHYFIPCLSSWSYFIRHPPRKGTKINLLNEFNQNLKVYEKLVASEKRKDFTKQFNSRYKSILEKDYYPLIHLE